MFCIDGLQQSCFTHQYKDLELEDRHCYSYIFLISLSCSFFVNGHYFNGDPVSVASKKKKKRCRCRKHDESGQASINLDGIPLLATHLRIFY